MCILSFAQIDDTFHESKPQAVPLGFSGAVALIEFLENMPQNFLRHPLDVIGDTHQNRILRIRYIHADNASLRRVFYRIVYNIAPHLFEKPLDAAGTVLVAICVVLTMIVGLVPSIMSAKKDPVIALRTEEFYDKTAFRKSESRFNNLQV